MAGYARGCRDTLEPGSGLGVLTALLSDVALHVMGVELDSRSLPVLREVAAEHANITVINSDILAFETRGSPDCVAGNPPYSISGPLLARIVTVYQPRRAVLTLQKEVANRLAAKPGTSAYGRITVLVQLVYDVKLGGVYPPHSFYPPPEVYSRIVVLEAKRLLDRQVLRRVENVTRCLFSMRNRLASSVVKKCCGLTRSYGGRRVYQLTPEEVLGIALECEEGVAGD